MRKDEQGRPEHGRPDGEEAEKTGRPDTSRDAIEDLEPPEERADGVKGGYQTGGSGGEDRLR